MLDIVSLLQTSGAVSVSPAVLYIVFMVWKLQTRVIVLEKLHEELSERVERVMPETANRVRRLHHPAPLRGAE